MSRRTISWLIVLWQVSCIGYLLMTAPIIAQNYVLVSLQWISLILVFWAFIVMKIKTFHVISEVRNSAELITTGPYFLIRHPMYTAILLYVLPILITYYSWHRILVFLLLIINLFVKMHQEEKYLKQRFNNYETYVKRSWRIIPLIY